MRNSKIRSKKNVKETSMLIDDAVFLSWIGCL